MQHMGYSVTLDCVHLLIYQLIKRALLHFALPPLLHAFWPISNLYQIESISAVFVVFLPIGVACGAHRTFFRGNPMTKICIKSERVAGSGKVWTTCGANMSKSQPALFEKSSFQKPLFYYKKRSKIPKSGKNLKQIWNFFFLHFWNLGTIILQNMLKKI